LSKQAEAEIDDLHIIVFIYHNVVEFDISMSNLFAVQVLHSHDDPTKDLLGFLLGDPFFRLRLQVLVEGGFPDVLHHQYHLFPSVDRRVELYYVRVVQLSQNSYLPFKIDFPFFVPNEILVYNFQNNQLVIFFRISA